MKKVFVSFSFDDGCLSTYTNAYPILKENGLLGCICVVTDFVGKENKYTWDNIKEMVDNGWEVISHTRTHDMWDLTPEKLEFELGDARRILKEHGYSAGIFNMPGGPWQEKQGYQFKKGTPYDKAVKRFYEGDINGHEHPVKLPVDPYSIGRYGCECYDLEQYNPPISEILKAIDKSVDQGDWCHLGWHNVEGRHVETFRQAVARIRKYMDEGKMQPATLSQAAGLAGK